MMNFTKYLTKLCLRKETTFVCLQNIYPWKCHNKGSNRLHIFRKSFHNNAVCSSNLKSTPKDYSNIIIVDGKEYKRDKWTNITPKINEYVGRNLHLQKDHPIYLIKEAIVKHFYKTYIKHRGVPLFAVFDNISPVVSTLQNFDSMLIKEDHVSRKKSDNYYINQDTLLRAHTTAHENELIKSGLNGFLIVGDVYRRDTIDSTHFPVFHQMEGVRLFNHQQLFAESAYPEELNLFEEGIEQDDKQACHTLEASKLMEYQLKQTIEKCMLDLFGKDIQCRWIDAYFPFTHPSYELEIKYQGEWVEMLGCGILRQEILNRAGAQDRIGWAFGLGLERLAMKLFQIPDIRFFWNMSESFLSQFRGNKNIHDVRFQPLISKQPAVHNDLAFYVNDDFNENDFHDLVRNLDDNGLVESIVLVDEFDNKELGKTSHCYRIFYRHTSRTLSKHEINEIEAKIKKSVETEFNVKGRW